MATRRQLIPIIRANRADLRTIRMQIALRESEQANGRHFYTTAELGAMVGCKASYRGDEVTIAHANAFTQTIVAVRDNGRGAVLCHPEALGGES